MQRLPFAMLVLLALATRSRAEDPPMNPAIALKGFDPVELVAGKEVAGDSKLLVQRGSDSTWNANSIGTRFTS